MTKATNTYSNKIASILAFLLGFMSIFAGGSVLLGIDTKDYTTINWLISYNVLFGIVSIFVGYLIWKQKRQAIIAAVFVLAMHLLVLIYLKFMSSIVASESIKAMLFRVVVWLVIVGLLLLIPKIKTKKLQS